MNDSNIIEFTKPLEPYQHDMLQAASLVLSAFDASSRIHADNFVYHYTSADGLMGILNSRSLWFTDYNSLNDESEGQYIFSLARQILSTSSYPEEYKNNVRWVLFDNEGYRLAPIKSNEIFAFLLRHGNLKTCQTVLSVCLSHIDGTTIQQGG